MASAVTSEDGRRKQSQADAGMAWRAHVGRTRCECTPGRCSAYPVMMRSQPCRQGWVAQESHALPDPPALAPADVRCRAPS